MRCLTQNFLGGFLAVTSSHSSPCPAEDMQHIWALYADLIEDWRAHDVTLFTSTVPASQALTVPAEQFGLPDPPE